MRNRLNLDGPFFGVNVVEDSKSVRSQFPLCQSVRPQSLVVSRVAIRLLLQGRLNLLHDSPSVPFAIRPQILERLGREMDCKHSAHSVYHPTAQPDKGKAALGLICTGQGSQGWGLRRLRGTHAAQRQGRRSLLRSQGREQRRPQSRGRGGERGANSSRQNGGQQQAK